MVDFNHVLNQLLFENLMKIGNPFPRRCAHAPDLAYNFRSHRHSEAFKAHRLRILVHLG